MKPFSLLIINSLTLIFTLAVNYLGGTGEYFGNSVGEISSLYPTIITPAAYAFSIWALIYLGLMAFVLFQWYTYFAGRYAVSILPTGLWLGLANLCNALWVWAWTSEYILLSTLLISLLLFALVRLVIRLRLELYDAPLQIVFWIWWPVCLYTGWIVLATVLNISVGLKSSGLLPGMLSEELWATFILIVSSLIYIWLTFRRNMREAALVGVWGLAAIGVKQWEALPNVGIISVLLAGLLFLIAGIHGYRNRKTSPLIKMLKGEWK